tara:strand:+ start:732 stop:950 length:219 start_codon:yes stop_codon:yes gene_type:complete
MPSARNNPPEKTEGVTLLKSCVANGERQAAGANLMVTPNAANLLIGSGLAVAGDKKPAKKQAKAKPAVDATR